MATNTTLQSDAVDHIGRTRLDEVALGMTLLGLIISSILYGISLTQAYKYFQRFKKDPVLIKFLVTSVLILNTASVFLVGHASWYYLVTKAPRRISVWSLNVELALSMAISGISETFLAFRVWKRNFYFLRWDTFNPHH
ncbi:hypothetical protein BDQ17DRAFT_764270 [Cyathus striatus]|nr:hypothetical protein BDQ17DRAFT_764270 [Cyathus striatus]